MLGTDSGFASSSETDSASWSFEDDVEVHTENTGEGIILNTQINVLLNTKSEASCIREISLFEFSVLDLETSFQDLIGFVSSNGDMDCNLFISFDAETSDCESGS